MGIQSVEEEKTKTNCSNGRSKIQREEDPFTPNRFRTNFFFSSMGFGRNFRDSVHQKTFCNFVWRDPCSAKTRWMLSKPILSYIMAILPLSKLIQWVEHEGDHDPSSYPRPYYYENTSAISNYYFSDPNRRSQAGFHSLWGIWDRAKKWQ